MPEVKSPSIKAVELTRKLFETIYGNIGLLKFSIEQLTPKNGTEATGRQDSKKWEILCSFYKTLGSSTPTQYKVFVDLNDNAITIKEINKEAETPEQTYKFTPTPSEETQEPTIDAPK